MSQFDEQKDQVAVEQILRVVFLDAERQSPVSSSIAYSFILPLLLMQCNYEEQKVYLTKFTIIL